jgi:hypothetical protein
MQPEQSVYQAEHATEKRPFFLAAVSRSQVAPKSDLESEIAYCARALSWGLEWRQTSAEATEGTLEARQAGE